MKSEPEQLVESFFRHESANLVAVLTRAFGFALIDVVEDMVQESMLEALQAWRQNGVPHNPAGWLHRVAKNRILDVLRREQTHASAVTAIGSEATGSPQLSFEPDEINDSLLRMIFACCHPTLDRQSQLALTLKVLCGLGDHEIARGLLISPAAAKKRVTRARQKLQLNQVPLELPSAAELSDRLDAVHEVLYLMFNEGYSATRGDVSVRIDLCEDAARLCHLICEQDVALPTTRALLALMLYHAARFDSRTRSDGAIVLLEEQDRTTWDRDMTKVADYWLIKSGDGQQVSRFHFEAAIARVHCHSASFAETDWAVIVKLYGLLLAIHPSPIYTLNRALALGQLGRVEEGLALLNSIKDRPELSTYPLLHCAFGDLLMRSNRAAEAIEHLTAARKLVQTQHERSLLDARIAAAESMQ